MRYEHGMREGAHMSGADPSSITCMSSSVHLEIKMGLLTDNKQKKLMWQQKRSRTELNSTILNRHINGWVWQPSNSRTWVSCQKQEVGGLDGEISRHNSEDDNRNAKLQLVCTTYSKTNSRDGMVPFEGDVDGGSYPWKSTRSLNTKQLSLGSLGEIKWAREGLLGTWPHCEWFGVTSI